MVEPIRIRHAIGIGKGDNFAVDALMPTLRASLSPLFVLIDQPNIIVTLGDLPRAVRRAVVDDNDFIIWIVQVLQRGQTRIDGSLAVVHANNHRYFRMRDEIRRQGVVVNLFDLPKAGFCRRLRSTKSESPVLNLKSFLSGVGVPIIGPGKDYCAGGAGFKAGAQLPGKSFGLEVVPLA
jgi:hypothetical protein